MLSVCAYVSDSISLKKILSWSLEGRSGLFAMTQQSCIPLANLRDSTLTVDSSVFV